MYYQIKINRLPNKIIKWSVTFGNDNSNDTEGQLIISVVKEFTSRLEVLEQMNQDDAGDIQSSCSPQKGHFV